MTSRRENVQYLEYIFNKFYDVGANSYGGVTRLGYTNKEDIESGSLAAAKGGFTTVVCMPNTNPMVNNEETLAYIKEKTSDSIINILQVASISKNAKGNELVDMEKLIKGGPIGFSDDSIEIKDNNLVLQAMIKSKELEVPVSFQEEDYSLIKNQGINDGDICTKWDNRIRNMFCTMSNEFD